jgi:hypothetical protein
MFSCIIKVEKQHFMQSYMSIICVRSCECGNECSCFLEDRGCLDQLLYFLIEAMHTVDS